MTRSLAGLDFAPVLPLWLLAAAALVALLALLPAIWRRARGVWWRAACFALVLLALANPRLVEESAETRPDIALLVVDRSDSTLGRHARRADRRRAPGDRGARRPPAGPRAARGRGAGGRQPGHAALCRDRARAGRDPARAARRRHRADRRAGARHPRRHTLRRALPRPAARPRRGDGPPLRIIEAPGFGIVGARSSCASRSRIWAWPIPRVRRA
jgi:hypothetical protein